MHIFDRYHEFTKNNKKEYEYREKPVSMSMRLRMRYGETDREEVKKVGA
ncbi:MAG: hypothetical protein ABIE03_07130 [Patescibacteria group bacterium]|nr:hypothetical protein [Patescibacteria group bacterium]